MSRPGPAGAGMSARTMAGLLAASAGLAVAAGCGDEGDAPEPAPEKGPFRSKPLPERPFPERERLSRAAYERALSGVRDRHPEATPADVLLVARTPEEQAVEVEKVQAELRAIATELDRLKPPRDAERPNDLLADALATFADDAQRVIDAARAGDQERIDVLRSPGQVFTRGNQEQLFAALKELDQKGYEANARLDERDAGSGP